MPEEKVSLTEQEMATVRQYGQQHGLSDDEAASKLASDFLAARHHRAFNRPPAKVYKLNDRNKP